MESLHHVPQRLHDSEINFSVSCFYDGQWTVKMGDDMNGYSAETTVMSYEKALEWLDASAKQRYPESFYATGKYPEGYTRPEESSLREP